MSIAKYLEPHQSVFLPPSTHIFSGAEVAYKIKVNSGDDSGGGGGDEDSSSSSDDSSSDSDQDESNIKDDTNRENKEDTPLHVSSEDSSVVSAEVANNSGKSSNHELLESCLKDQEAVKEVVSSADSQEELK